MNFVDRFPLQTILAWLATQPVNIEGWKNWGKVQPEYVSHAAIHRLFLIINEQLPGRPLGLIMGRECRVDTLGLFGQIGQHCRTLNEGARLYLRFQRLAKPSQTSVDFDPQTQEVAIVVAPLQDPSIRASRGFRLTFMFAQTMSIFRQMLDDPDLGAARVEFVHDDDVFRAEYEAFFGCEVAFGCSKNRIAFSNEAFERPIVGAIPQTRPYLEEFALSQWEHVGAQQTQGDEFVTLLRAELREAIPAGQADAANIARRLSVSPRTLQRRLATQDLAFREVVDEVQTEIALNLLAQPAMSVQEIAEYLGYTQASSFHRAFKRWTGQTPADARRDLVG